MNPITAKWVERAEYDLETAEAMLKAARYLYVAFACQQAVEKYLKAIIQEKSGQLPPYTHNLPSLFKLSEAHLSAEEQDFLTILNQYYISARYVDFKQKLFEEMNREKAKSCLQKTRGIVTCLPKSPRKGTDPMESAYMPGAASPCIPPGWCAIERPSGGLKEKPADHLLS